MIHGDKLTLWSYIIEEGHHSSSWHKSPSSTLLFSSERSYCYSKHQHKTYSHSVKPNTSNWGKQPTIVGFRVITSLGTPTMLESFDTMMSLFLWSKAKSTLSYFLSIVVPTRAVMVESSRSTPTFFVSSIGLNMVAPYLLGWGSSIIGWEAISNRSSSSSTVKLIAPYHSRRPTGDSHKPWWWPPWWWPP